MQNNFIFRDRSVVLRQAITAWLFLAGSTILFTIIAVLLSALGLNNSTIAWITTILIIPLLLVAHYHLYRYEMQHLNVHSDAQKFRIESYEELVRQYPNELERARYLYTAAKQTLADLERMRRDLAHMRIDVLRVQKRAQARGRANLIERCNDLLADIQRLAAEIEGSYPKAQEVVSETAEVLNSVKRNNSLQNGIAKYTRTVLRELATVEMQKRKQAQLRRQWRQVTSL